MKDLSGVICITIIALCSHLLSAQQKPRYNTDLKILREKNSTTSLSQRQHYMLQLRSGVKRSALQLHQIRIVRPLSENLFIAQASPHALAKHRGLFEEISAVNDLWKISEAAWSAVTDASREFTIKTNSPEQTLKTLSSIQGVKVTAHTEKLILLKTTLEVLVRNVIILEEVTYAGIDSRAVRTESRVLDLNLNPNTVNRIHHDYPDLNGEGMTLSIKELKYNTEDIDLQGRDIPSSLSSNEQSSHATDMATIAAGAGNSFVTGRGVAWASGITSSDFSDLLPDQKDEYALLDTWAQNHSYGTLIENSYGVFAEAFDQSTQDVPQLLHVFSSGNLGMSASSLGMYQGIQGFANITGNAKMSKNTIAVGAVDTTGNVLGFSSRGPAHDGRIKPELVAYSTQGSSNAAALVSGTIVLLQQAYKESEGVLPPSALLKSLLINSASDAGPPGIDFITGFGNTDAYRTLLNLLSKQYFSGSVAQGETKTFSLPIPAGARNLKITLLWNDLPALPNANIALVNDLDLEFTFNSDTWLPWILNADPNAASLAMPPSRGKDHLNNVEQITVADLQPGTYTISTTGFDVSQDQEFFIAYQWDIEEQFEWKFPTGSDNIPYNGETATYFYWQSTLQAPTGKLEYTLDDGATWIEIASGVDLSKGFYRWSKAPQITAVAQARMVAGNSDYATDRFVISLPLHVTTGFNCSDSTMFQWPSSEDPLGYEIYTFVDTFIEPLAITNDTLFILTKDEFPSKLFAVQPLLRDGFRAIRSPTFDYDALGTGCFLLSFFDQIVPPEGIQLNALLGTTYHIDQLIFEHEKDGTFEPIEVIDLVTEKNMLFVHNDPHQGLNRYRVRLQFINGAEVVSDTVENFFLTKTPFAVFPNPVSSSGELRVFSKAFQVQNVTFSLFRSNGTLVGTTKLISDREFIPLSELAPGLYLYSLTSEEGRFLGKLMVK